jgi:long-chain fatty acid transport protein
MLAIWHCCCLAQCVSNVECKSEHKVCLIIRQTLSNVAAKITIMKKQLDRASVKNWNPAGLVLAFVAILGIVLPGKLNAVGFRLPNQDPEAIARGNAFAATADDPSAIYYNPAGITQLEGQNLRAGIYAVSAGIKYSSPNGNATANSDLQPVPQVYYADSFTNIPISIGLGIYAPYGLGLNWGNNTPFNTIGESGKVMYLCFNPIVAWRVTKTLSIGGGPTINYSQATLDQAIPVIGGQSQITGDGADVGFNVGILWQPHPKWSFGVNYRSATTINYKGTATQSGSPFSPFFPSSTASSAAIRYPQYIVGGISFRPTPDWNLEFDLDWTDWHSVKQINVLNTPFGNQTILLNYRSSFMYEFGVTRQLGNGWFASVGYFYSENSSPDANFNPLIPDADLQLGGIGFGHHGKRWDWSAAYQFGYNGGRTVSGSAPSPSGQTADGTYKTFNNAVNLAVTLKF